MLKDSSLKREDHRDFCWTSPEHLMSSLIALPGDQTLREVSAAQDTNAVAHSRYV